MPPRSRCSRAAAQERMRRAGLGHPALPFLTSAGQAFEQSQLLAFLSFPFCSIFCNSICCKKTKCKRKWDSSLKENV